MTGKRQRITKSEFRFHLVDHPDKSSATNKNSELRVTKKRKVVNDETFTMSVLTPPKNQGK